MLKCKNESYILSGESQSAGPANKYITLIAIAM